MNDKLRFMAVIQADDICKCVPVKHITYYDDGKIYVTVPWGRFDLPFTVDGDKVRLKQSTGEFDRDGNLIYVDVG